MRDELPVAVHLDLVCQPTARSRERGGIALRDRRRPRFPVGPVETLLERAKQRIVMEPVRVALDEGVELRALIASTARPAGPVRALEQREFFPPNDRARHK